jgi:Fe-S-cluster containining protein
MISYYSNQYETLRKENNAESVSSAIHGAVEDAIKELISNEKEKTPSCGKGCSFCCYLKTDISDDEAVLLTEYSREIGFKIDYNYLEEQIVKTDEDFLKIPYAKRKCVFLNEEGACSVYEHRPIACRKLIVVSNSEDCDTENKSGERVARLASVEAESISVAVLNTRKSGGLAEMMIKAKN